MPRKAPLRVVAPPTAAGSAPSAVSSRVTRARSPGDRSRTTTSGCSARVGREDAPRAHVGDPAVVVEGPRHPDDAEARLAARGQLDGERCPGPDPERLREPDADLGLVVGRHPAPARERRVLEARVVAGEGDELDRLAEREESAPRTT